VIFSHSGLLFTIPHLGGFRYHSIARYKCLYHSPGNYDGCEDAISTLAADEAISKR